ncbi:hypothetical protein BCR33DRAFT_697656 [Rhizoclosmatium globosum]|uniref:tRNA ligase n=1 Tax=Rhizoclosmatium globosum TaxID=329046 RepID=A0A1Y2CC27_9FUNG|nr:hypothetical protein BCR33DRAFT_697656 [Rhizoclosmatium globosum]|eukprot:ORY44404.1 hypothetical protein BCR33DRAFT_697656 [Rhizoclosmatium globosum]
MYRKAALPTMARGLFALNDPVGDRLILLRGYDKFFNLNETETTSPQYLQDHTRGPYEMSVKENGCIIFITGFKGALVVSSKHSLNAPLASTGLVPDPGVEGKVSHAQKGEEWVDVHLASTKNTRADLADFLESNNVTAVFELADDDFEEHILEYPPGKRGLYLHGINKNQCVPLETWDSVRVAEVASQFGFLTVEYEVKNTFEDVMTLANECRQTGSYKNKPVEGFVVRCTSTDTGVTHMFKIKYDEPYLMFREWREITNALLNGRSMTPRYRLSETYTSWCEKKLITHPDLFDQFKHNKGIIAVRNLFLLEHDIQQFSHILAESSNTISTPTPSTNKSLDDAPLVTFPTTLSLSIEDTTTKVLIIPMAIPALGKTTLGSSLMSQFYNRFGHTQSDAHKKKTGFLKGVMLQFEKKQAVYADRNNHLDIHRTELCKMFRAEYPDGKIVGVEWDVKGPLRNTAVGMSVQRIEERGESHQTLTPKKVPDYARVSGGFFKEFMPVDRRVGSTDSKVFDALVVVSLDSSTVERVRLVAGVLGWELDEEKLNRRNQ